MPYLGLGTYQSENRNEVVHAVKTALDVGYRHIDTASVYENEYGIGKAIKQSSVPREDLFVTSKVWNTEQGHDSTIESFHNSLDRLQLDYLDLYLIHWPVKGKYKETWKALEYLYAHKKVRAIGVSNFLQHHLEHLMDGSKIAPMVNQMEFHPYLVQQNLIDFCVKNTIQYEAWSPFMVGKVFELDFCKELAAKHKKSIAQIILRWNLQKGVVTIPKSVNDHRITANANIFDFELSKQDMAYLDSLHRDQRTGAHPDHFNF